MNIDKLIENKSFQEAYELMNPEAENNLSDSEFVRKYFLVLLNLNKNADADEFLNRCIEKNDWKADVYFYKGVLEFLNDNFKNSTELLEKSLKIDSEFMPAIYLIYCIALTTKELEKINGVNLDEYVNMYPSDAYIRFFHTLLLKNAENTDEYNQSLKLLSDMSDELFEIVESEGMHNAIKAYFQLQLKSMK